MKKEEYIVFIFNNKCEYSGYLGGYITEWYSPHLPAVIIRKNYSNWKDIEGKLRILNIRDSGDYYIYDNMTEYNNKMEELKKFQASE